MRKPISLRDNCLKRVGFGRAAKSERRRTRPSRILRCEALETRAMLSVYYVDSAAGNDSWSGLAGSYASGTTGPWQTIAKVNSMAFAAGDSILFKRGDTWREELVCDSGTSSGRINYGDYGDPTVPKPQILGSTERDLTTDWTNSGGNIWSTAPAMSLVTISGSELLPNPSFASNANNWTFYKNTGVAATGASDQPQQ